MDMLDWGSGGMCPSVGFVGSISNSQENSSDMQGQDGMLVDEDYMQLMTDTLFSTISSNQPIYFPDSREIGKTLNQSIFVILIRDNP